MSANANSLDDLIPRLYEELRSLARSYLRREHEGHTLSTTALVHEAWLRLAPQHSLGSLDSSRFFAIASTTMRRVLVDYARQRRRIKRGGDQIPVALDDSVEFLTDLEADELVALDEALERLTRANPRAGEVVMHRFFGGLSLDETADVLHVSTKTVQRDWITARAWLRKEVAKDLGVFDVTG